jgi:hypothetical protein
MNGNRRETLDETCLREICEILAATRRPVETAHEND